MTQREFWIEKYWIDRVEADQDLSEAFLYDDYFFTKPEKDTIHVREVNPALDQAIEELLQVAYRHQSETTHPFDCGCRTCRAIAAYKAAKGEK